LFMLGAVLVVGCFTLRSSYVYRLIFCIFSLPLMFSWQRSSVFFERGLAWAWIILLLLTAYLEPLVYNYVNLFDGGLDAKASRALFKYLYPVLYGLQWIFVGVFLYISIHICMRLNWMKSLLRLA